MHRYKWLALGSGSAFVFFLLFFAFSRSTDERLDVSSVDQNAEARMRISSALSPYLDALHFPESLTLNLTGQMQSYRASYTVAEPLQDLAEILLKRYKPDYAALFMMDADTGEVLVFTSFQKGSEFRNNLVKQSSFPAASLFKIVTAASLVDKENLKPNHPVRFNGGNWTLYKKNVLKDHNNRWTRTVTLEQAFARSMNTPFAKLVLKQTDPQTLDEYAHRFLFNQFLPTDFYVEPGKVDVPDEKGFRLGEIASGYNRTTLVGPVQGAMMAAAVINGGRAIVPHLVQELRDQENKIIYQAHPYHMKTVISKASAKSVQKLMEATVKKGTSRSSFRALVKSKKFKDLVVGGKTGHIYSRDPAGSADWFVGFAQFGERRLALSSIIVNKDYWRVKSSYLAQRLFRKAFESENSRRLATESK